jgi:hypothetical protein
MKAYYILLAVLLLLNFEVNAQKDFNATQSITSISSEYQSTENKLYISGGVGFSTILYRIYAVYDPPDNAAYGTSQSLVYNGNIDYRINGISLGAGVAYQTATGVPYIGSSYNQAEFTESLTRLNISGRVLFYPYHTNKMDIYTGFRIGESYWTDVVTGPSNRHADLTLGNAQDHYLSIQVPVGARIFFGNFGFNAELGIGTPYFAEGGITFKIEKD